MKSFSLLRATVAIGALVLVLSGCMSYGKNISDDQVNQFVRGKTTEQEVIATLGPPTMTQRSSKGEKVDTYSFASTAPNAKMFIPFIGPWLAGADVRTRIVNFKFNTKGTLEDWDTSNSSSVGN